MKRYDPKSLEPKWQKIWADNKVYEVSEDSKRPKIYASPMLPYPSGTGLHTGHVRNYSIADTVARFHRQKGFNTMSNIAWDSFGLPAENFAIKTGMPPEVSTANNIAYFKEQLQRLGISFDWTREFNTSDPSYYKWTQWVFTLLFKQGLAYQAEKAQWWCDLCKTVLADEQVLAGKCWRHDSENDPVVTKRNLKQWFFKITEYADEILEATDSLDWPEKIKTMQKNWIGRSEGAQIRFPIYKNASNKGVEIDKDKVIEVYTTRPDTIFGASFLVLAPEHPLVEVLTIEDQKNTVSDYVLEAQQKDEVERMVQNREKTGVFTGSFVVNPLTQEKIPVWIADYVLTGYGSGAIMAVPAHDERDFEFAQKFNLPIKNVISAADLKQTDNSLNTEIEKVILGEGVMINSGKYDGLASSQAREKIVSDLESKGLANEKVQFKIRDWLISRQRYWGAPVPIIHCPEHGAVPVPDDQLPVELPVVKNYAPDGTNHSVLAGISEWVNTTCPTCSKPAKRETDVLDGYVCSSWYLYRYTDAHNENLAFDPKKAKYWMPLDFYFGGDHAVAHLMHIRFMQRVFIDAGVLNMKIREPVKRLVYNGYINAEDGAKMSKSKGNTVDPMDIINSGYGADSLRVFELFIAPYDQDTTWNSQGVPGCYRFLQRVWNLVQEYKEKSATNSAASSSISQDLLKTMHHTIKKVTNDLENLNFNTAIAAMMECVNELFKLKVVDKYESKEWPWILQSLVQLIAPFAPHIAEELWQQFSEISTSFDSVHINHWPTWDEKYLVSDSLNIVIQVNGKVRANIKVVTGTSRQEIEAKSKDATSKYLENQEIKKTIFVPNKLVNFVI